ncbi:MAG: vWA domain-containing protein [Bacilli bacterium]|nr:vWA domain-containing protein [Bacilli bacterium]
MKKKKEKDIVFLLDRSGSMYSFTNDTIGGYNSYLEKERKNSNTRITTVLFDDQYEVLHNRIKIGEVKNITDKEYYTRGCTALYDAIGKTIMNLDNEGVDKVLFVITTDGLENASREYNKDSIKSLIKKHKNWEFMYIGANIDSYDEGAKIGIRKENIANRANSREGMARMFGAVAKASKMYEEADEINISWKNDLEDN